MTALAALLCQEGNEGRARRVWLFNMQIRRWRLIGWRDSAWLCYDVISRHTHTHSLWSKYGKQNSVLYLNWYLEHLLNFPECCVFPPRPMWSGLDCVSLSQCWSTVNHHTHTAGRDACVSSLDDLVQEHICVWCFSRSRNKSTFHIFMTLFSWPA